jgi:hypothetical protein
MSRIVKVLAFAVFQKWLWCFARGRVIMAEGVRARLACLPGFEPRGPAFFGIWSLVPLSHAAQHSVHPTGGSRRVFKQFAWLEVGSVKAALSRPAHPRVTHTVRRLL